MKRMIDCEIWDDPWFSDLEPDQKLMFMYLFTNRRVKPCGAFDITLKAVALETGFDKDTTRRLILSLESKVTWWEPLQTIFVINFYERQCFNPNFTTAARKTAEEFPADVQNAIYNRYPTLGEPLPNGIVTSSQPSQTVTQPMGDQRQDRTESETGEDKAADATGVRPTKEKIPPTMTDVATYFAEHGMPDHATRFFAFYASNGWKVGKNPMKSWTMAATGWMSRERGNGNGGSGGIPKQPEPNQPIEPRFAAKPPPPPTFRLPGIDQ